jgi:hypothetical protein
VTRDALQRALWPDGTFVDFEHALNAAIRRLRCALEDDASAPRYIETLARAVIDSRPPLTARQRRRLAATATPPPGQSPCCRSTTRAATTNAPTWWTASPSI